MKPHATSLVVFLTRGMSLQKWEEAGIFEREMALYERLRPHLAGVTFLSYGDAEQFAWDDLDGMHLLPNRWGLSPNLYSLLAPLLHRKAIRQAAVLKANQLNGAWCAAIAKVLWGKKLIVRCGFVWSEFFKRVDPHRWKYPFVRGLEYLSLQLADRVVVTTQTDQDFFVQRYRIPPYKIRVIPNFVDTDQFRPRPEIPKEEGLLSFIGRFEEQKNPMGLLEAIQGLPGVRLLMIGEGSLRPVMERKIREERLPVELLGVLPHSKLPEIFNRSHLFILPSFFEGHPKVLLEAMACGLPVIGADSPGIQEVLASSQAGVLCGTSPGQLRDAIRQLLQEEARPSSMGLKGRAYVERHFSLKQVAGKELELLKEFSGNRFS